jgi:hypothetical protein
MSFIEQRLESVIATELASVFTAAALTCDIRTMFAEPAYGAGDEEIDLPSLWILASPNAKPVGSEPFREVVMQFVGRTHYNDDYDRNVFAEIYRLTRKTIEETDFDFGAGLDVHEYEIPSTGDADIGDNIQSFTFSVTWKLCCAIFDL